MEGLKRRKLNPHLGAEVDAGVLDLGRKPLSLDDARSLFTIIMEHKVVVLRNTGLDTLGFQEFARMLQIASLENVEGISRPDQLPYEEYQGKLPTDGQVNKIAPAVVAVGPWPTKTGVIGNAIWHVDKEYFQHGSWLTLTRMSKIPRDPKTGEVLPCGDTLFADTSVAWEDLPEAEKALYQDLRLVHDYKVAFTHIARRAEQGREGAMDRLKMLDAVHPSVERPIARKHPVTGKMALIGDPGFASHIVGKSPQESEEIMQRLARLCEVPEYQLRLPWYNEGDVVIWDNYVVKHRIVADFRDAPLESRLLENIGTQGFPQAHNVLRPGIPILDKRNSVTGTAEADRKRQDEALNKHHEDRRTERQAAAKL